MAFFFGILRNAAPRLMLAHQLAHHSVGAVPSENGRQDEMKKLHFFPGGTPALRHHLSGRVSTFVQSQPTRHRL